MEIDRIMMQSWARFWAFFMTFRNVSVDMAAISRRMLCLRALRVFGWSTYTFPFKYPHKKKSGAVKSDERGGRSKSTWWPVKITFFETALTQLNLMQLSY